MTEMRNYKILWRSADRNGLIGNVTVTTLGTTTYVCDEFGRVVDRYGYDHEPTEEELDLYLRGLLEADPVVVYDFARKRGAKGGLGHVDLVMDDETAREVRERFGELIELREILRNAA